MKCSVHFNCAQLKWVFRLGRDTEEKVGRVRHCRLDREVLSQAEAWLSRRREFWEDNLDRLGGVLAQHKAEKAHAASAPPEITPATARRPRKPT